MARLFLTPRGIDFFNDTVKELIKDVAGQKIYYYPISVTKTKVHEIYEESPEKIFDDPLEIECFVKWESPETSTNRFGIEYKSKITCYVQSRDMIDKEIKLEEGDFFSFGPKFFEVTSVVPETVVHGQVEYKMGLMIKGVQARKSQFESKIFGPTDEKYSDDDAVQKDFVQQRGFADNRLGPTGDSRDLEKQGVIDKTIKKPDEVSTRAKSVTNANSKRSSFYGDGDI